MSTLVGESVNILQEIKGHSNDVTCVEFYGNSLLITGSSDKTVRVWRWYPGKGFTEEPFSPLLGHKYGITSVRISPQGSVLASASVDGTIALWNITKGTKTATLFQEAGETVRACAFSPDGSTVISSDDSGAFCVWGNNKNLIRLVKCHDEAVHTVSFSVDSSVLMTGCTLGNLRMFLFESTIESHNFEPDCSIDSAHDLGVLSSDFCKLVHTDPSDSQTKIYTAATCGTDHLIKIWRIFCLKNVNPSNSYSRLVPKSAQEHISGSSTIYCTEKMNAECVLTIPAHGSSVTCVRFNILGTMIVSSSLDKTVKLWDLQGNCLRTLSEHLRYVNCIAINNDSTIVASGSNDRTVIIWDLTGSFTIDSHISGFRSLLFHLASSRSDIPLDFICPITHEIMKNPVLVEDGFSYEAVAIKEWFATGKSTSPMTNLELHSTETMDNAVLRNKIEEYLKSMNDQNAQSEDN